MNGRQIHDQTKIVSLKPDGKDGRAVASYPGDPGYNPCWGREARWHIGMSTASGSEGPRFKPR